jgi:hypothetical protein
LTTLRVKEVEGCRVTPVTCNKHTYDIVIHGHYVNGTAQPTGRFIGFICSICAAELANFLRTTRVKA